MINEVNHEQAGKFIKKLSIRLDKKKVAVQSGFANNKSFPFGARVTKVKNKNGLEPEVMGHIIANK
jgi:hypothetical protein